MSNEEDEDRDDAPAPNQMIRRSFEGVATLMQNAATQALTAKATADINARWMIAMRCPRDLQSARVAILHECSRPGFARSAIFAVPRGTSTVRGLSIRFAEEAAKIMGNIGCEAQTLYDSDTERLVRVTVCDFESNMTWSRDLTISKTKLVKRDPGPGKSLGTRLNSYGDTNWIVPVSEDDMNTKEAAAISKASRTGILRLVPAWLKAEAMEKCEQTAENQAAKDPDAERRKIFDAFATLNVKPSWLSDWLGYPLEQATPATIVELQQLYRAIRDGELSPTEAMDARKGGGKEQPGGGIAASIGKQRGSSKSQPTSAQAAPASKPMTAEEQREIESTERAAGKEQR